MGQSSIINLKLRETASVSEVIARLSEIDGVTAIEQLLPQETDQELASLYFARVDLRAKITDVLADLISDPDVEWAETPGVRKLIKPKPKSSA